ncbi:MAG: SMC-Scp complex subunit ScpB [Myxococcota bacterium]
MERNEQRRIVEALILASPEPISAARIAEIVPGCKPGGAKDLVNELNTEYEEQDRAFEVWEVAGGYQMRTRAEFSGYLQKLQKTRPLRLSRAALETLAIIAYKQPATRAEIEGVRGVDAGAVVKSLLERNLIKIAGQREIPGRPMLYATTKRFLEIFGLTSIKELPTLRDLDELAREPAVEVEDSGAADANDSTEATEAGEASEEGATAQAAESADPEADTAGAAAGDAESSLREAESESESEADAEADAEDLPGAESEPDPGGDETRS